MTGKENIYLLVSEWNLLFICANTPHNIIRFVFCFLVKEDWNVRITKLRKQVEEIFNLKFGT